MTALPPTDDAVMSTSDRLIYMANQIARNFAVQGEARAIAAVEEHIRRYWDPDMRRRIVDLAAKQPDNLSQIAKAAIARMADH